MILISYPYPANFCALSAVIRKSIAMLKNITLDPIYQSYPFPFDTYFYQNNGSVTIITPQRMRTAPTILYPSNLAAAPVGGAEVVFAEPDEEEVEESAFAMMSEETTSFSTATGAWVERVSRAVAAALVIRKPCSL